MGLTSALDNLFGAFKKPVAKQASKAIKTFDNGVIKTGAAIGKNNKALGAGAGVATDVAKATAKDASGALKIGRNVGKVVGSTPVVASGATLAILGAGTAGYIKLKEMNMNTDAGLGITDKLIDQYRDETAALKERMDAIAGGTGPAGADGAPGQSSIYSLGGATGTAGGAGARDAGGSSVLVPLLLIGGVAGGGYWLYKRSKKNKR